MLNRNARHELTSVSFLTFVSASKVRLFGGQAHTVSIRERPVNVGEPE